MSIFRTIYEALPQALLLVDDQYRVQYANKAAYALGNQEPQEDADDPPCIGKVLGCATATVSGSFCGKTLTCRSCAIFTALRYVMRTDTALAVPRRARLMMGQKENGNPILELRFGLQPLQDEGKKLYLFDITNITSEKREEREVFNRLRNVERDQALTHALFDALPDMVALRTAAGVYLQCNRSWAQFYGFQNPEDLIGKSHSTLFGEAEGNREHQADMWVITSGQSHNEDLWIASPEGHPLLFRCYVAPVLSGIENSVIYVQRNVTEQYEIQSDLERAEALLQTVADNATPLIWIINTDLQITLVNHPDRWPQAEEFVKQAHSQDDWKAAYRKAIAGQGSQWVGHIGPIHTQNKIQPLLNNGHFMGATCFALAEETVLPMDRDQESQRACEEFGLLPAFSQEITLPLFGEEPNASQENPFAAFARPKNRD